MFQLLPAVRFLRSSLKLFRLAVFLRQASANKDGNNRNRSALRTSFYLKLQWEIGDPGYQLHLFDRPTSLPDTQLCRRYSDQGRPDALPGLLCCWLCESERAAVPRRRKPSFETQVTWAMSLAQLP